MRFLKTLLGRAKKQPLKIPLPNTGITVQTWIGSELWKELSGELRKPIWQHAVTILVASRPRGFPMRGQNITDTQAALELGRVEGYNNCLDLLQSLATPPQSLPQPMESDYGTEE